MFGVIVVGALGIYVVLFLVVKSFSYKFPKTIGALRGKRLFAAVVLIVLFGDTLIGRITFYALCARDSGEHIYAQVDRKEGLLVRKIMSSNPAGCESICMELLGIERYDLVEMYVKESSKEFLTPSAGLNRYHLAKIADPECAFYDALVRQRPWILKTNLDRYRIKKDECLANTVESKSRAGYFYDYELTPLYVAPLFISRSLIRISDRNSGKVLSENISYGHSGGWIKLDGERAECP